MTMMNCRNKNGLILFGSFILHVLSLGFAQSFGILYTKLLEEFDVNRGEIAWVASLFTGILLGAGLPSGMLLSLVGPRVSVMSGSLLMAAGMFGSAFITKPYLLYLTYGLIAGSGASIIFIPANAIVFETFVRRRGLAMSLASMGGAAGGIALPPLTAICVAEYGWRGSFLLLLGGFSLQGVVIGCYLNKNDKVVQSDDTSYTDPDAESSHIETATVSSLQKCKHVFSFVSARLLIFTLSGCLTALGYFIPFNLLPDLMVSRGLSLLDGSWAASGFGIGSIVGRLVFGPISDINYVDRLWLHILALSLAGGVSLSFVFLEEFHQYLIMSVVYGAGTGTFAFLQSVIVNDLAGVERFSKAFGFVTTLEGIGCVFGPPLAGWIADYCHSDTAPFYFTAAALFVASIVAIPITNAFTRLKCSTNGTRNSAPISPDDRSDSLNSQQVWSWIADYSHSDTAPFYFTAAALFVASIVAIPITNAFTRLKCSTNGTRNSVPISPDDRPDSLNSQQEWSTYM